MRRTVASVLLYLGVAIGVVGGLGLALDWGIEDEEVAAAPPSNPAPSNPAPSSAAPSAETPEAFFESFTRAVIEGDRDFLVERLHPAVVERYGAAQCQEATKQLLDPQAALRLVEVRPERVYEYASDGQRTMVGGTSRFVIDGTLGGQTAIREYHFGLVGGRYRIFLDCGELRAGG